MANLKQAYVKSLLDSYVKGDISFGRYVELLNEFLNQQTELAVDKALTIVCDNIDGSHCYDGGSMCRTYKQAEEMLSLRKQIIEELKLNDR